MIVRTAYGMRVILSHFRVKARNYFQLLSQAADSKQLRAHPEILVAAYSNIVRSTTSPLKSRPCAVDANPFVSFRAAESDLADNEDDDDECDEGEATVVTTQIVYGETIIYGKIAGQMGGKRSQLNIQQVMTATS